MAPPNSHSILVLRDGRIYPNSKLAWRQGQVGLGTSSYRYLIIVVFVFFFCVSPFFLFLVQFLCWFSEQWAAVQGRLLSSWMMVVCVGSKTQGVWSGTKCRFHLLITSASFLLSVFACSIDDVVVAMLRSILGSSTSIVSFLIHDCLAQIKIKN